MMLANTADDETMHSDQGKLSDNLGDIWRLLDYTKRNNDKRESNERITTAA